jgi:hypothetical protein
MRVDGSCVVDVLLEINLKVFDPLFGFVND